MSDKIKGLLQRALDWWNKFTARQKTLIVSALAGVVVTIAILAAVLSRPQYTLLLNCENTKEAAEVVELLEDSSIDFKTSKDGLRIDVRTTQEGDANLLLGANNIRPAAYGIENVTDGGFSTTESDKQKKYKLYLEDYLARDFLERFSAVKSASVKLNIPENTGTLISEKQESYASIVLELDGDFTQDNAAFLARAVATALGNDTTKNVDIMDTDGNMLFSGGDDFSVAGNASSQLGVKAQAEAMVKKEVQGVLLGTNVYDSIVVGTNLIMDFSTTESTVHDYSAPEGASQGMLSSERSYAEESTNGGGTPPGTDANDETTYVYQDNEESTSTLTEEEKNYLPNESVTSKTTPGGTIDYGKSSLSVTAITNHVIREEDAKAQGLLDGITWEEYKLANSEKTVAEVDQAMYDLVAKATGFSSENITIAAWNENIFYDKEGMNVKAADVAQIVLIVIILALLAFVVLRSMKGQKEAEPEPELSVENLLQSTPEEELENIELEENSETKKVIDKFVDENPEAAASLLRNWLNEDWG